MKFEFQKSEIQKIAIKHSYTTNNIEKVIRLSFILIRKTIIRSFKYLLVRDIQ